MNKLIDEIKENNEDFEFYPTSDKIMKIIAKDIKKSKKDYSKRGKNLYNILDIGCGNGNALKLLEDNMGNQKDEYDQWTHDAIYFKKYGIEKSQILINNADDIFVIGRDFMENTLFDADMDIIFSNPPYSIYVEWIVKLIKECSTKTLYLVIPERWKKNESILSALRQRVGYDPAHIYGEKRFDENPVEILDTFDFMDSEYRKARVVVDIIKISYIKKVSGFDLWFDKHFKIKADVSKSSYGRREVEHTEQISDSLVTGQNLIERLEELYQEEMERLLTNYKALETIDAVLLNELGIDLSEIKESLHNKIKSLKQKYWRELFNNLDKINQRLTSKYRKLLIDKLNENLSIDITCDNMYMIVLWVIKNANIYQDEQLKYMYLEMTYPQNIKLYKSNKHFVADTFRYNFRNQVSHYLLDYRLVFESKNVISYYSYYENDRGITNNAIEYLDDMFTIAITLGFKLSNSGLKSRQWKTGVEESFYDNDDVLFAKIRCYKNGNIHVKFNQEFMMKLNIEAGKLFGWIKDPIHCAEEMEIPIEEIEKYYNSHVKLEMNNMLLLT